MQCINKLNMSFHDHEKNAGIQIHVRLTVTSLVLIGVNVRLITYKTRKSGGTDQNSTSF